MKLNSRILGINDTYKYRLMNEKNVICGLMNCFAIYYIYTLDAQ